jgi:hypothetical protein
MYCQEIGWRKFVCSAVWANTEQGKYFTNIENGIRIPNITNFFSTCLRTAIRNHISGLMYLCPDTDMICLFQYHANY